MSKPVRLHIDRRAGVVAAQIVHGDPDELFRTPEAAQLLGVSPQFLELGRHNGTGPKFIRLSPRMVRYKRSDLVAWLRERSHVCTKEYA